MNRYCSAGSRSTLTATHRRPAARRAVSRAAFTLLELLLVLAILVVLGGLVHLTTVLAMPRLALEDAYARIERSGETAGWLGVLHPAIAAELELPAPAVLFELDVAVAFRRTAGDYRPVSRFPALRRPVP